MISSDALQFLQSFLACPSPSGYEQPAQAVWRDRTAPFVDRIETDVHGNSMAWIHPDTRPRVLFTGHCDELGFQIRYIDDNGFLYFATIGGHDIGLVPGRTVTIHTANGPLPGVIGKRAIHLMSPDDRKKVPEIHELWIDIGVADKAEAQSLVSIGDPATYDHSFKPLRGSLASSRAFDDRAGAFIVSEVLRRVSSQKSALRCGVVGVSTVQEEIGLRGATTSAFSTSPDIGIALDVTHATDHPDVDKRKVGEVRLGGGPVICRGANINPRIFTLLVETAKAESIPFQLEAEPRGTGTDANAIQLARGGIAAGLIGLPLRYMHTPNEVIDLEDLDQTAALLVAFLKRIGPDTNLIP
jgi:endoglucanase